MKIGELREILSTWRDDQSIDSIDDLIPHINNKTYSYRCTLCGEVLESDGDLNGAMCRCLKCKQVSVWTPIAD